MRLRWITMLLALASVVLPEIAWAQTSAADCDKDPELCAYDDPLSKLVTAKAQGNQEDIRNNLNRLLDPGIVSEDFVLALARGNAFQSVVDAWERSRVDKQIGPSSKASGSTDLVSRPGAPELLGLAMQLGALTETVNGSTATFSANAEGAFKAIIGHPVVCLECTSTPWKNLNFTVSFDLNKESSQQVATSGAANASTPAPAMVQLPQSSRQLSAISARYDIFNPLDPRSPEFKQAWSTSFAKFQGDLLKAADDLEAAVSPIFDPLDNDPEFTSRQEIFRKKLGDAAEVGRQQLNNVFKEYFAELLGLTRKDVPNLDQKIAAAAAAFASYAQLNQQAVAEARGKPQLTAEYTFNRPQSQPDTHDFTLILGLSPKNAAGTLFTMNLGVSLYGGSIPSGSKYGRLRDYQVSAQFDRPLGDLITHPVTLSLTGYVQYQPDPSVLNIGPGNLVPGTNITLPSTAQVLLGTKGTLAVAQAKITINTKAGVNIPLAVSWANKTDLLNAHDVRGHIGITYDFSSLSQVFGAQGTSTNSGSP